MIAKTTLVFEANPNPDVAPAMRAYMKDVAPFLGIRSKERRALQREAWKDLRPPTSDDLGIACELLMRKSMREYHYSCSDLIAKYIDIANSRFLADHVESLLTTKSWWDTVDSLGTAAVSPLCWRYDASKLVERWSRSENLWLNRAAIQHQRGWKRDTDVPFVLGICAEHAASTEFFVTKAIGWALRDIARFDSRAVSSFLVAHPELGTVAVREAQRGLGILERPRRS